MSDLTDFLLARIAEDEAVAKAASPGPWTLDGTDGDIESADWRPFRNHLGEPVGDGYYGTVTDTESGANAPSYENATHIALHDPARVLAECEAKRQIVEFHRYSHECSSIQDGEEDNCAWILESEDCSTVRLLGLPYADRPGYREEWKA